MVQAHQLPDMCKILKSIPNTTYLPRPQTTHDHQRVLVLQAILGVTPLKMINLETRGKAILGPQQKGINL